MLVLIACALATRADVELYRAFSLVPPRDGAAAGALADWNRAYNSESTYLYQELFGMTLTADGAFNLTASRKLLGSDSPSNDVNRANAYVFAAATTLTTASDVQRRRLVDATTHRANLSYSIVLDVELLADPVMRSISYGPRIMLFAGMRAPAGALDTNAVGVFVGIDAADVNQVYDYAHPGSLGFRANGTEGCLTWACCGPCDIRANDTDSPLPVDADDRTPWLHVRGDFTATTCRVRARFASDTSGWAIVDETFALTTAAYALDSDVLGFGFGTGYASAIVRDFVLSVDDATAATLEPTPAPTVAPTHEPTPAPTHEPTPALPPAIKLVAPAPPPPSDNHVIFIVACVIVGVTLLGAAVYTRRVTTNASQRIDAAERRTPISNVYASLSALVRRDSSPSRNRRSSVSRAQTRSPQPPLFISAYGDTMLRSPVYETLPPDDPIVQVETLRDEYASPTSVLDV